MTDEDLMVKLEMLVDSGRDGRLTPWELDFVDFNFARMEDEANPAWFKFTDDQRETAQELIAKMEA